MGKMGVQRIKSGKGKLVGAAGVLDPGYVFIEECGELASGLEGWVILGDTGAAGRRVVAGEVVEFAVVAGLEVKGGRVEEIGLGTRGEGFSCALVDGKVPV